MIPAVLLDFGLDSRICIVRDCVYDFLLERDIWARGKQTVDVEIKEIST